MTNFKLVLHLKIVDTNQKTAKLRVFLNDEQDHYIMLYRNDNGPAYFN
jgi:hypothetical protein